MNIGFAPFLPWPILAALAVLTLGIAALAIYRRMRGSWIRALAAFALLAALANPVLMQEDRDQLSTIVPVIVDRSPSQETPERIKMTDDALAALKDRLAQFPRIEPRIVEVREPAESESPSTRLFAALSSATADVPPARVGGAIFLTDGQIHDIPGVNQPLGFDAPIHGLITGKPDEFDRRIEVVRAPRFGIVNDEDVQVVLRVVDDGKSPGGTAAVTVRMNGDEIATLQAAPGQDTPFSFKVPHAGNNVLEFAVAEVPGEVTPINNRTVQLIEGIRKNMRVLLVSGEPHAGERAWRNLLKSDAAVDLVHFTILRPPDKQDGTPINELSLIAFPTRELFVDKISSFDLIIFDRYQDRPNVLPTIYYDYMAQYVENGGALLVAAGPEHATGNSIALTPLSSVLPAEPTGQMIEKPFYPRLSEQGRKHPVTRGLDGSDTEPPHWGRWFRSVDVEKPQGQTVMVGADNHPLLVLNRVGQGRVAMLLSDQGWLWARGYEGGGPHVSLYRRIAHWLLKEPALEEEALTAHASGRTLEVTRQTIGDDPGPATVKAPSGKTQTIQLKQAQPGLYQAQKHMDEIGLYQITSGNLSTLVHVGAVDAPEFKAMISTTETLKPLAEKTKGLVTRVASSGGGVTVPPILPVRGAVRIADNQRLTIRMTDETVLKGVNNLPLFAGFAGLAALLFAFSAMWWREGR
ncbi:glutamine amidotransferase [Rhizobium sp. CB3090]|uniref:glutamine amidotransferase n=1 Tax=Rhizobium sp. CB3090 TaxID=3039156 RepID=UPI0024B19F4B|nr:glutamine amidotransferase [Rhizobium sp. CB3090]WFU07768.1 glutamine amidotransferase [Rhizobium sp. CB3090]